MLPFKKIYNEKDEYVVWWTDMADFEIVCFEEENKCIKGRYRIVRTFCCEKF